MNSTIYVLAGMPLFAALIYHMLPVWQRPGLFFGITVRPDFYATGVRDQLVQRFRIFNAILAIIIGALTVAFLPDRTLAIGLTTLGQIVAVLCIVYWTRSQAAKWAVPASTIHTAALNAEHAKMPGGWIAFTLPILLFILAAICINANWAGIPQRFPVHYNAAGEANRWSSKSVRAVYTPLLIGISVQLLLLVVAFGMSQGTRRVSPDGSRMRMLRTSLWLMLLIEWATALLICAIAVQPALPSVSLNYFIWAISAMIVVTTLGFGIRLGQLQAEPSDEPANTPEDCWHLGSQIYYNPGDSALMVEKRIGIGYSINLGNKLTWLLVPLVLLIALAPVI